MNKEFTILIIGNVIENVDSFDLFLKCESDIKIISTLNIDESNLILDKKNIDLVLCDIQIQDQDMFNFIEEIKRIQKLKDLPIIFITEEYNKVNEKKAYSLGAIDYILKTIDEDLLFSKLKMYIKLFEKDKLNTQSLENLTSILQHKTKMVSIGEMLGVISHQLKQPLNILSLFCEDMKLSYDYEEINKKSIKDFSLNTRKQIHYMQETIDVFLDFFNPCKYKKDFLISDAINFSLDLLSSEISNNNITIKKDFESDYKLNGVRMELSQVIINLIVNSIQAYSERNIENRFINIELFKKDDNNFLKISDNAGGIKLDNLEKIFKPQFTTKLSGSGMGLYMVNLVIKNSFNGILNLNNYKDGVSCLVKF